MLVMVNWLDSKSEVPGSSPGGGTTNKEKLMGYMEDVKKVNSDLAGIYKITNSVNGKCFIGQSIHLRKRLEKNIAVYKKIDSPLYKDFEKYGLEKFKVRILWSTQSKKYNEIKSELDKREQKAIVENKAYKGYNIISKDYLDSYFRENVKTDDGISNKRVYAKDLVDKCSYTSISTKYLSDRLQLPEGIVKKVCDTGIPYKDRYLISTSPIV